MISRSWPGNFGAKAAAENNALNILGNRVNTRGFEGEILARIEAVYCVLQGPAPSCPMRPSSSKPIRRYSRWI